MLIVNSHYLKINNCRVGLIFTWCVHIYQFCSGNPWKSWLASAEEVSTSSSTNVQIMTSHMKASIYQLPILNRGLLLWPIILYVNKPDSWFLNYKQAVLGHLKLIERAKRAHSLFMSIEISDNILVKCSYSIDWASEVHTIHKRFS